MVDVFHLQEVRSKWAVSRPWFYLYSGGLFSPTVMWMVFVLSARRHARPTVMDCGPSVLG